MSDSAYHYGKHLRRVLMTLKCDVKTYFGENNFIRLHCGKEGDQTPRIINNCKFP